MVRKLQVSISLDLDNVQLIEKLREKGFNLSETIREYLNENQKQLKDKYGIK